MTDAIDRLLARDARDTIPDDRFTRRVMAALPAPQASARPWLRPALILGSAALGSVLAVALSPGAGQLFEGFKDLMQFRLLTAGALSGLGATAALLVSAIIYAVSSD
jgi:hypothetical protein